VVASVRSLTRLNGLSDKLSQGRVANDYGPVLAADRTYLSTKSPGQQVPT
jgi:hypothetical protein